MTVKDIFEFLNQKFPVNTACDFDNVGILVGNENTQVKKAIITLDCTMNTIKKAVDNDCELIITHHPVIFNPLKTVLKGSIVYEVIKNNLTVISMHTNLDIGVCGVNDTLCNLLFKDCGTKTTTQDGYTVNRCTISPLSSDKLADKLKKLLSGGIKYMPCKTPIKSVLVCAGSGGNYITEAYDLGCDALITADVKHNHFLDAERLGLALYDAGHFNTEDIIVKPLKKLLCEKFKDIEFLETHHTSIKYL